MQGARRGTVGRRPASLQGARKGRAALATRQSDRARRRARTRLYRRSDTTVTRVPLPTSVSSEHVARDVALLAARRDLRARGLHRRSQ